MSEKMSEKLARRLVESIGGEVDEVSDPLPDGSGFLTASFPLPKDHWLTKEGFNIPPMPMRMGCNDCRRELMERMIRTAGRYAVRSTTDNGKINDFDPDALVQNLIIGMLGYWTETGLSSDESANPKGENYE